MGISPPPPTQGWQTQARCLQMPSFSPLCCEIAPVHKWRYHKLSDLTHLTLLTPQSPWQLSWLHFNPATKVWTRKCFHWGGGVVLGKGTGIYFPAAKRLGFSLLLGVGQRPLWVPCHIGLQASCNRATCIFKVSRGRACPRCWSFSLVMCIHSHIISLQHSVGWNTL